MAIILNDNIKINAGKPSESKYLSSSGIAYSSTTEATINVPISERYLGLTVLVDTGTSNIEYWWREGVEDVDLIEKKFASEQLVGDFITGATNLGYFEGFEGVQRLLIAGTAFGSNTDNYYSEYQWYYVDAGGDIRIGAPAYGESPRIGYVNSARDKSWVWNVDTGAWEISLNDIVANVGSSAVIAPQTGTTTYDFTGTTWVNGTGYGIAQANVTAYGILNSGTTEVTVGSAIYKDKSNQELHLRTIINDTPQFLRIESDDYYIRFSGASSVLSGASVGASVGGGTYDVFTGQTGNTMYFRTLTQSGDTTITQTAEGGLIIYSSSDGSADAITGATNVTGTTGIGVYSGSTDRKLYFKTLVGSGDTTVSETTGGTVIIGSTGGAGNVFTEDILVSIASGKTFGKYENGDVIPASGKTSNWVILDALAEALEPTLILGSSSTDVAFGESGKTVNVTFSYTINTIGASVDTAVLEWRRGNTGAWSGLTSDTGDTSYFHTVDDSADRFNTAQINYRYTVVDTGGGSGQTTYNVTPQAYAAPTFSPDYDATGLQSYESETLREIGNVDTTAGGTITSNRSLVNLTEYRLQRDDGGGYVTIASGTSVGTLLMNIGPHVDGGASSSATVIRYRIQVDDEYTTSTSSVYTINLRYASYFGYNTNSVLNSAQIQGLGDEALLTSRTRTVSNVTAGASEYTYVSYPASFGDLTSVILDGASPVLGAFTKLSNVSVTNYYGEVVSNIVYRTNAVGAFTNNELAFS